MNQLTIQDFYSSAYSKLEIWLNYQASDYASWRHEKNRIYNQISGMSFVLCSVSDVDSHRLTDMAHFVIDAKWYLS
jgi:hypothetical protein